MVFVYCFIYTTNFHRKRYVLACALIVDAVKKLSVISRWRFNTYPATNYASNCKISSTDTISCGQKLLLGFLFSIAIHLVGFAMRYIYEMSNKAFFLTVQKAQKQQHEYEKAISDSDKIARATLPAKVWNDFKLNQDDIQLEIAFLSDCLIYEYPEVTVLYGDIVGFTALASVLPPQELLTILDTIFKLFDDIADKYDLEKIKTVGDCYVVCAGLNRMFLYQISHSRNSTTNQ